MAKYSPFAEKAGMQKVAEQQSVESVKKLNSDTLSSLDLICSFLEVSVMYESKLESLNEEQIRELKTAFMANKHPRFKKEVARSRHEPYGKTAIT